MTTKLQSSSRQGQAKYRLLSYNNEAVSVTGTTNETALRQMTVPGGIMGLNGRLLLTTIWTITNNANNKTLRARFGGLLAGFTGTSFLGSALTTNAGTRVQTEIANRNSRTSQIGGLPSAAASFTGAASGPVTASIDTAADQLLVITGTLANAADTITLESYRLELILP